MTFLDPTYLWAFLALAVPLAIHLWSRKKVAVIKVGSTKFLRPQDPRQTSNIKLNEITLLLLRMLCLTLLVLILAEPRLKSSMRSTRVTYLVEPSLLTDSNIASLVDSLPEGSVRLLKPGFPEFDVGDRTGIGDEIPKYWQLAQEIKSLSTDSIVVFAKALQNGLKGMRPEINANVQWIIWDFERNKKDFLSAKLNEQEVELLAVAESAPNLFFEKETLPVESDRIIINKAGDSVILVKDGVETALFLSSKEPLSIHVLYEADLSAQMKYLEAAYSAIGKYLDIPIEIKSNKIAESESMTGIDFLVWLSEKPLSIEAKKTLLFRPDIFAEKLVVDTKKNNEFHLTGLLNAENVVAEHLAEQLIDLMDFNPRLDEKLRQYDKRVVDVKELAPIRSIVHKERKYSRLFDLSPWLWVALVVVLMGERIFSKHRKQ